MLHCLLIFFVHARASAEKFPGREERKKYQKIAKKTGGGGGATEKRPKNSTSKLTSTISVPCMKIQGGYGLPTPRCRHPCIHAADLKPA